MTEEEQDELNNQPVNKPITEFRCHPLRISKARKTMHKLVDNMAADVVDEVLSLPLTPTKGLGINELVAMSEDQIIFSINMKTGESYYE